MVGTDLKRQRQQAGIAGYLICQRTGLGRSRLSDIERGYVTPRASEVSLITDAITTLTEAKRKVDQVASQVGWPV